MRIRSNPLIKETSIARLLWILATVMAGVFLGYLVVERFRATCLPLRDTMIVCKMIASSPPWSLLTSLIAAPALVLTWYWRTISKDRELFLTANVLDTEVQCKVAEKKLAAILELFELAEPLARNYLNARPESPEDLVKASIQLRDWMQRIREKQLMFDRSALAEMWKCVNTITNNATKLNRVWSSGDSGNLEKIFGEVFAASDSLLDVLRREMGTLRRSYG